MTDTDFRRALGPWSAAALTAGGMIGTGIFSFVADVAVRLPSRGAILGAWLAGAGVQNVLTAAKALVTVGILAAGALAYAAQALAFRDRR